MTPDEIARLKLSPAMKQALQRTKPGKPMTPGPTRAALMRRGLVWTMIMPDNLRSRLSPSGVGTRHHLMSESDSGEQ